MKIKAIHSVTGEIFEQEAKSVNAEFIESMSEFSATEEKIKSMIDNLSISADAKSLLYTLSRATIRVGEYVLKIGKKIIDFVCSILNEFPNAVFGLVFAAIAGFLIASIPVIGAVLGGIVTPILLACGLVGGLVEDLKDKTLARKIAEINAKFSPLNA